MKRIAGLVALVVIGGLGGYLIGTGGDHSESHSNSSSHYGKVFGGPSDEELRDTFRPDLGP
ncbi:MAG: hypothetical protein JJE35_10390 [Thermoleophilia bacterium]|nr:hypothetical protein [Thermoleophilia bacterium]